MTLGEQIRTAREEKNLSQEELAEALGVSRQAVSKWENDTAVPQGANMNLLAAVLGLETAKEETLPKKHKIAAWIGWALAIVLLLALVGTWFHQRADAPEDPGEPPEGTVDVPPAESSAAEPALHSICFYDETQEEIRRNAVYASYDTAEIDSILIQWTGDTPLESVKMFYTPTGEKPELAEEFKGPSGGGNALLLPADSLHRKGQAHLYFELHFAGSYTITTDDFNIYLGDGYTMVAYIEGFDGEVLTYDKVEWVDVIGDQERAEELGITDEDAPNGFYLYNEQDAAAQRLVADVCVYDVLNWEENFVRTPVSASQFRVLLEERVFPGTPYQLTVQNNQIVEIRECYIP